MSSQSVTDTAPAPRADGESAGRANHVVALICGLGLVVTALAMWVAVRTDRTTEQRLLETQSRQAANVLAASVSEIDQPLITALEVEASVLPERRREVFLQRFARHVGPDAMFVSASLWQRNSAATKRVAALGAEPGRNRQGGPAAIVRAATRTKTSVVRAVAAGPQTRIAYALADPSTGYVVYAERALPSDRLSPVDPSSGFERLNYAIYLGRTERTSALLATDVELAKLPLTGTTFQTSVPSGDRILTLVTRADAHLGADMNERMPWYVLAAGLLLTAVAAAVARQTVRARLRAESDTSTIRDLYDQVDTLFAEQRALYVRLQRSLLPQYIPDIPGLEIASEYAAGGTGIDIGGDWYSLIRTGADTFAFVVGDVSGHGVDAVAEMARARFTVRAHLFDGDSPAVALRKSSRQFDLLTDGHLVTVIAGVGNVRTGEISMANAGHPLPLLIGKDGSTEFVEIKTGPPLGVGETEYDLTSVMLPEGSALMCYTDGLIERRNEDIAIGMERLAKAAASERNDSLPLLLGRLLDQMREEEAADDIALLAFRRVAP